jgi:hypothetical protein
MVTLKAPPWPFPPIQKRSPMGPLSPSYRCCPFTFSSNNFPSTRHFHGCALSNTTNFPNSSTPFTSQTTALSQSNHLPSPIPFPFALFQQQHLFTHSKSLTLNLARTQQQTTPSPHTLLHKPTSSHASSFLFPDLTAPYSPNSHSPNSQSPNSHSPNSQSPNSHSPNSRYTMVHLASKTILTQFPNTTTPSKSITDTPNNNPNLKSITDTPNNPNSKLITNTPNNLNATDADYEDNDRILETQEDELITSLRIQLSIYAPQHTAAFDEQARRAIHQSDIQNLQHVVSNWIDESTMEELLETAIKNESQSF